MSEQPVEYIADAIEMLGTGYSEPSVEIEASRTVMERRDGKLQEVQKAAFVKISTAFKAELKIIDETALKVWLYIALSVNRYNNKANPGLRKIHEDTGLAVNTIRAAIDRLENDYHLLTVETGSGKASSMYEPAAYVSAKRGVSADDTLPLSVSVENRSVSVENRSVSAGRQETVQPDLTRLNQSKDGAKPAPIPLPLDWQVATDQDKIIMPSPDLTFQADCEIAVMNVCKGAVNLEPLVTEFIVTRRIFPQKKQFSGWRTAFQQMHDAKPNRVYPQHITEAILQLTGAGMTVSSPFSIVNTAISLANPMVEAQLPGMADVAI